MRPFCSIPADRLLLESAVAIAFPDAFPITDGHTLVVPRKHVESIYELGPRKQADVWMFVGNIRQLLIDKQLTAVFWTICQ